MYTLFRKELSTFLSSLIGYTVIIVFLLVNGLFLWVFPQQFNIFDYGFASLDNYFTLAPWVFLFLIPAITMRSFVEELKAGTMEMLLTKPITEPGALTSVCFSSAPVLRPSGYLHRPYPETRSFHSLLLFSCADLFTSVSILSIIFRCLAPLVYLSASLELMPIMPE